MLAAVEQKNDCDRRALVRPSRCLERRDHLTNDNWCFSYSSEPILSLYPNCCFVLPAGATAHRADNAGNAAGLLIPVGRQLGKRLPGGESGAGQNICASSR